MEQDTKLYCQHCGERLNDINSKFHHYANCIGGISKIKPIEEEALENKKQEKKERKREKKEREYRLKEKKKQEERLKASSEHFVAGMVTFVVLEVVIWFYIGVITAEIQGLVFLMLILGISTWKWSGQHTIIGGILRGMTIFAVWSLISLLKDFIFSLF